MLPVRVVAELLLLVLPPQVLALPARDVVVRAQLLLLVQSPQVLALPARDAVVRVQLLLRVQPQLLAQAPREAAVAKEAHQLTQSFSAALAGISPSPVPPM